MTPTDPVARVLQFLHASSLDAQLPLAFEASAEGAIRNRMLKAATALPLDRAARRSLCRQVLHDVLPLLARQGATFDAGSAEEVTQLIDEVGLRLLRHSGLETGEFIGELCFFLETLGEGPRSPELDRGFEERLARRWTLRLLNAARDDHLLARFHEHRGMLLQFPDEAVQRVANQRPDAIDTELRDWLRLERLHTCLTFIRGKDKWQHQHIAWTVRPDLAWGFRLVPLAVGGRWIVARGASMEETLTTLSWHEQRRSALRTIMTQQGWDYCDGSRRDARITVMSSSEAAHLLGESFMHVPLHGRNCIPQLVVAEGMLQLVVEAADGTRDAVMSIAVDEPDPMQLLAFLETIERVADHAIPEVGFADSLASPTVDAVRCLLLQLSVESCNYTRTRSARLVYVPSDLPHPLGGVPRIGAEFLAEQLRNVGWRVDIVELPALAFRSRLVELLGAKVIGIGVYIHNRNEVAALISLLRGAGYTGRIVLGGPEARDLFKTMSSFTGWNAIVRGEAEDVLPVVLQAIDNLAQGANEAGLALLAPLSGVVVATGEYLVFCDTATTAEATAIVCPTPYNWARINPDGRLKMNFTRGCPYKCGFCPLHQGRRALAADPDTLWAFSVLAVADAASVPAPIEDAVRSSIAAHFGTSCDVPLNVLLHLLFRSAPSWEVLWRLCLKPIEDWGIKAGVTEAATRLGLPAVLPYAADESLPVIACQRAWLRAKVALLLGDRELAPFEIETSEDNTLVNRDEILEYLGRRDQLGLSDSFTFNPGQNTVRDLLMRGKQVADIPFIERLSHNNHFRVALGTDGTSNTVLRQNRKPDYRIQGVVDVNYELGRRGILVVNNYILLTPLTTTLEAVEALLLFVMLPLPWRDYGDAINLRVVKEETTVDTDEGVLFDPVDAGYDVPFRDPAVASLLMRCGIHSGMNGPTLRTAIWSMVEGDNAVRMLLPQIVRRWLQETDPEMVALGSLVREARTECLSWPAALKNVHAVIQRVAFDNNRTSARLSDMWTNRSYALFDAH